MSSKSQTWMEVNVIFARLMIAKNVPQMESAKNVSLEKPQPMTDQDVLLLESALFSAENVPLEPLNVLSVSVPSKDLMLTGQSVLNAQLPMLRGVPLKTSLSLVQSVLNQLEDPAFKTWFVLVSVKFAIPMAPAWSVTMMMKDRMLLEMPVSTVLTTVCFAVGLTLVLNAKTVLN